MNFDIRIHKQALFISQVCFQKNGINVNDMLLDAKDVKSSD